MTKPLLGGSLDRLGVYVRRIANEVGLRDWTIALSPDPCKDGCNAQVSLTYGRKYATICFRKGWQKSTPEDLRQTVVHELLHCHVNRIEWPVYNICDSLSKPLFDATIENMKDWIELAVDGMAEEWARHLPLPGERR